MKKCPTRPAMPTAVTASCQRARRSLQIGCPSTIGTIWYEAPMIVSVIQPSVTVCVSASTCGW
jgi:hypothetical protein